MSPHIVAPLLFLNGIILYVPMYLPAGNKDARSMSPLDALLIGIGGALAVLPGISRAAAITSVTAARGGEPKNGYNWFLVLSVPVLVILALFDLIALFAAGMNGMGFGVILQSVLAGITSFAGAFVAIHFVRIMLQKTGIFVFSYYCWGAAIFTFILYLI